MPAELSLDRRPPDAEPAFTLRRAAYEPEPGVSDGTVLVLPPLPPTEPTPDLPDNPQARQHAARLMRAILEVLDGRRPVTQLHGIATLPVIRGVNATRGQIRTSGGVSVRLVSVHLFQPHDDAVEAAAVCRWNTRPLAVAGRFDNIEGHGWRCTTFRLLARAPSPDATEPARLTSECRSATGDRQRGTVAPSPNR